MEDFGTLSAILANKRHRVFHITPDTTVFEAIRVMAERNVGALLVMDHKHLVGIVSERDYTRKIALRGRSSKQTFVKEIMLSPVITMTPANTVAECMRIMTSNKIRHVPVVEGESVVGVVSIGDLVNWIISAQTATISQMESYIRGEF